jgi:hypothetical protein
VVMDARPVTSLDSADITSLSSGQRCAPSAFDVDTHEDVPAGSGDVTHRFVSRGLGCCDLDT